MKKSCIIGLLCGLVMGWHGAAAVVDNASYARFFDRAAALLPGLTVMQRDLTRDDTPRSGNHFGDTVNQELWRSGTWEITGGRLLPHDDELMLEATGDRVDLTWRVDDPGSHPSVAVKFLAEVEAESECRVLFHIGSDDRFNRSGNWVEIDSGIREPLEFSVAPPGSRDAARVFNGIRLAFEGSDLAGKKITVHNPLLQAEFFEGFFRYEFELPRGVVWSAAAEISDSNILYINGERVDDESIVMPRPTTRGQNFYQSRRVPFERYLRSGRNVLALYANRTSHPPAAYLRGSVVMASGERVMLDTGTSWVWNNQAPENWYAPEFNDDDWREIYPHDDMPREWGLAYSYRGSEGVASRMSQFGLSFRPMGNLPCYDGFVKLRNPLDKKLYFTADIPFRLEALIPPGFQDKKPELVWEIHRYSVGDDSGATGAFAQVAQGRVADFVPCRAFACETPSVAGEINSARLARGIYVFTSRLLLDGEVVEERDPEPLVVIGKVKMAEKVTGDFWEQGMDLSLETVVDFTDPSDPHPSFETDHKGPIPGEVAWGPDFYHTVEPALIVERNDLKYRTTRPVNRAQFSYLVGFDHPGDWYLMVLEYPDDAERWIGVSCNADRTACHLRRRPVEARYSACSKCGPAIWTGGKYPNSGKMLEMKWLYRPDPGMHAINVMSLMKDTEAAAARLRIYHVRGRLPEMDAGALPWQEQRRFGMVTERTFPWDNGIYNLFSTFDSRIGVENSIALNSSRGGGQYSANAIVEACEFLRLLKDAASHYAEYMRFVGQNIHAMGCFQYDDSNTASQYVTGDTRIHFSPENMLARVLGANDLMFYASVEFVSTTRFAADGTKPEWFFADRRGERPMSQWAGKPLNLNFLHPDVEAEMLEVARQLAQKFAPVPGFLGVNWTALLSGFFLPSYRRHTYPYNYDEDPLGYGYDDVTISLFEQDTGIKVGSQKSEVRSQNENTGEEDSDRYEQRYQFLTSPEMKPVWLAWRAQKMAEFFAKINSVINEVRPGLETVAGCYLINENTRERAEKNIPFVDYLDSWGWNQTAFQEHDGVWMMPWLPIAARYAPASRQFDYARGWQANKDPDFYNAFRNLTRRSIMLVVNWIEVERCAANFPAREGWPRPYQQTMMAQQREEMALEPYVQAMIGFDPQMVMNGFTDISPYIGVEEAQRKFARVLRRLPMGKFETMLDTGFDTNFAIRALRQGDDYWFYAANPGYWPISGTIKLANAGKVINIVSDESVPMNEGAINITLEPFGIAAFRASPSEISNLKSEISNWSTDPVSDTELAHMRNIIAQARSEAERPGMAEFLGSDDHGILTGTIATAEQALVEQRYAAAWAALTDADFWAISFQKAPEIVYVDIVKPRTIKAMSIANDAAPVVDGMLDDRVWQDMPVVSDVRFVTREKEYSELATTVRAARSGNRLFLAINCPDPEPENIRGTTDKENVKRTIWGSQDDLLAIFIVPEGGTPEEINYYQMAITANGAKFDQHNRIRHGMHVRNYDYSPNWQAKQGRTAAGWTVEIEFDTLENFGVPLREGVEWQLNVHRQFRLNQFPASSWTFNPGQWHSLDHMGNLIIE